MNPSEAPIVSISLTPVKPQCQEVLSTQHWSFPPCRSEEHVEEEETGTVPRSLAIVEEKV